MDDIATHIYLRDTRDRVIDLLGFGETYPLRDLPVDVMHLLVPKGSTASIPIDASQRDCIYSLWEREADKPITRMENGAAVPLEGTQGTGKTITLDSPIITESTSFRVRSTRIGGSEDCWDYLLVLVEVKTGINRQLQAEIVTGTWLDPTVDVHTPLDVRLIPYGTPVKVRIKYSQKGAQYSLVRAEDGATISESDVAGTYVPIELTTAPMFVDTDIRIRILQPVAGEPEPEDIFADIVLPVVVTPKLDSLVFVEGTHIVDYAAAATIVITDTQVDIRYELYGRRLDATDFAPGPSDTTVDVAGAADDIYTVKRPDDTPQWKLLPGFSPLSASIAGNGGDLKIPAGTFDEDTLIQVRALKTKKMPSGHVVTFSVPLQNVAVVLARPNPAPALHFEVLWRSGSTSGALRMTGGQRGVSYHLSKSAGGAEVGSAGYFYDRYGTSPDR